jgi:hypothetical protein
VIYYTEDVLHQIDSSKIGGIEGFSWRKKKAVREICSIKLKFSDGSPIYTVFKRPKTTVKIRRTGTLDKNEKDWVPRFRVAGQHELEWYGSVRG